jgi:RNA polymerase sigma factor (sigma-70 family)
MAATETSTRASATLDHLYRQYVGDVYRYTYAVLGNHADAEDVTQTTFVNALRALERGEEPRNPSNWLVVIAHNVVRQRWRQAAARPSEVELVHDLPDASAGDDTELDGLVRALQRIPPAQREALVMRELEGRSYREISELLGLSTSALETLLFRARRSLAEELENLVTCQSAELAMSRRLDDRLSRKERRRLEAHLAECAECARLAETHRRQRKAFKVLALLPVPAGLALFKGAPGAAAAATLPTIGAGVGVGTAGLGAGTSAGVGAAAGVAGAGGAAVGGAAVGGAAVGGSLVGGAVVKVAAVVVAASVATGVGYEGVKVVRDTQQDRRPAVTRTTDTPPSARVDRAAARANGPASRAVAARRRAASSGPSKRALANGDRGRTQVAKRGKSTERHAEPPVRAKPERTPARKAKPTKPERPVDRTQRPTKATKKKAQTEASAPPTTTGDAGSTDATTVEATAPTSPSTESTAPTSDSTTSSTATDEGATTTDATSATSTATGGAPGKTGKAAGRP